MSLDIIRDSTKGHFLALFTWCRKHLVCLFWNTRRTNKKNTQFIFFALVRIPSWTLVALVRIPSGTLVTLAYIPAMALVIIIKSIWNIYYCYFGQLFGLLYRIWTSWIQCYLFVDCLIELSYYLINNWNWRNSHSLNDNLAIEETIQYRLINSWGLTVPSKE